MAKATLNDLASEVASDQEAIDSQSTDTRKRVISMGKKLIRMQKMQKAEQNKAKDRGEEPQTWKDWCEEQKGALGTFPESTNIKRYILVATYPGAYQPGMSIKEAYKVAGQWKKNAGNPPVKEKLTIKARPLITIGAAAGRLERKIESLIDQDIDAVAENDEWNDDDILGAIDALTLLKQGANLLIKKLGQLREKQEAT